MKIEKIIHEMQLAYGIQSAPPIPKDNPIPEETSQIALRAREVSRIARKKETQFAPKHPILLFAGYIFTFIGTMIHNFFNQASVRHNNDILFLANSLKNQGFITQKKFILFKQAYAEGIEPAKNVLKDIVRDSYFSNRLDRKNYIHLTTLAHNSGIKEVLQFLFALSSVSNIHRFKEELNEIVLPQEQLEMLEILKGAYENSSFPDRNVQVFSTLTARLEILVWIKKDPVDLPEKGAVLQSLKSPDEKKFKTAILNYLEAKRALTTRLEREYYHELARSFSAIKAPNAFIHFSQGLETISVLQGWAKKVEALEGKLEKMVAAQKTDETRARAILEDLKELYTIFGKILENEKEYSISPTAMGLDQGILRARWKRIGYLLHQLSGEQVKEHHLCGCIYDVEQLKDWPDVENWEITPSHYISQDRALVQGEKKPTVLGFYCNWGSGHKAGMQAIADALNEDYHICAVDLPQTALQPDTVQKLAGGDHTITSMYNTLVAGRHWKWITFLRNSTNSSTNLDDEEAVRAQIREQVLKQRPELILVDYGSHAPYILDVAQEMGIPFLRIFTDMDITEEPLHMAPHPEKHWKTLVPYPLPDTYDKLRFHYSDTQFQVAGYPLRPYFYQLMQELRADPDKVKELRKEFGIQDDDVVYLISNGGCGPDNPFPEWLAATTKEEGKRVPKGHVFVLTGNNKSAKQYLETYLAGHTTNPDLHFHIEGYIKETEKMAKLVALTATEASNGKRGLFIGKAGGASVAEALCMGTQLLIDMRENNEIPWEIYTSQQIRNHNLGDIVEKRSDFVRLVNERTGAVAEDEDYKIFRNKDPEKEIRKIVAEMIAAADNDPAFKIRRSVWMTNHIFTRGMEQNQTILNYFDSINTLNGMLKNLQHQKLLLPRSTLTHLMKRKPARIDFKEMALLPMEKYNKEEARLVVRYIINVLEKKEPVGMDLLTAAEHYLELVYLEHQGALHQSLKWCRHEPFLMEIAYLDRLIVSRKFKDLKLDPSDPNNLMFCENLYKTPLAKEQLRLWMDEKLNDNSNKAGTLPLFEPIDALNTFLKQPGQYNWLTELRIIRAASTFNHQLTLNGDGEVLVLVDGQKTPLSKLHSIISIGKRIIHTKTGKEYLYHYAKGLKEVQLGEHPDEWKDKLPLFKEKRRKTQDYRLEIITDNFSGREKAWLRLKDPKGRVYSVGRYWDQDVAFPQVEKIAHLPGNLRVPETYGGNSIHITKIDLENKQTFHKVKQYIEHMQRIEEGYNHFTQNSVSFVHSVCKELGIQVETKATTTEYFLPLPLAMRKFFLIHSWMRDISLWLLYPVTLIIHLSLAIFGAFKHHFLSTSPYVKPLFTLRSFFDPETIDSSRQLEAWKRCIEDELGRGVLKLDQVQAYAKTISRIKYLNKDES